MILSTRNPGKVAELKQVLEPMGFNIVGLEGYSEIPEPVEDGATFAENARLKALYYSAATGQWCLADDSGLVVDAISGQPGVHSARYAADLCPPDADRKTIDQANNKKLLNALANVPDEKRTARFVCHLALAGEGKVILEANDCVEGIIGHESKGDNGFGYDPLFYIPAMGCTTAQLPSSRKNEISHRGKALVKLAAEIQRRKLH